MLMVRFKLLMLVSLSILSFQMPVQAFCTEEPVDQCAAEVAKQSVFQDQYVDSLYAEQFYEYIQADLDNIACELKEAGESKSLKLMLEFKAKVQRNKLSSIEIFNFMQHNPHLPGQIDDLQDAIAEALDLLDALNTYIEQRKNKVYEDDPILRTLEAEIDSLIRKARFLEKEVESALSCD